VSGAAHLYVHVPFCAHRCGYCDFVTVTGRSGQHAAYVDAVLRELDLQRRLLAPEPETVFLGGGTPTLLAPPELERLLAGLPRALEVTVEANPETVSPGLAASLHRGGVNRVSLGAQTFRPELLRVLERRAQPDDVRRAVSALRAEGFANVSLDLIYGIPGQTPDDLRRDLEQALALAPEHLSCYELEAKPGTRFTRAYGTRLAAQAEALEGYFELVVDGLTEAGYRWYETANFCLAPERAGGRDLRARHNLGYWQGDDYLGLGLGAVSTCAGERWRTTPRLPAYLAALGAGELPPREREPLGEVVQRRERLMLGLRLDKPLALAAVGDALDPEALPRLQSLGLVSVSSAGELVLTKRGRFLGGAVTAELLA